MRAYKKSENKLPSSKIQWWNSYRANIPILKGKNRKIGNRDRPKQDWNLAGKILNPFLAARAHRVRMWDPRNLEPHPQDFAGCSPQGLSFGQTSLVFCSFPMQAFHIPGIFIVLEISCQYNFSFILIAPHIVLQGPLAVILTVPYCFIDCFLFGTPMK